MLRSILFSAGFGLLAATGQAAQVIFTIQGSVLSSTAPGYSVNDPLTLTFTTSSPASSLTASGPDYDWFEDNSAEAVFSSVTVTGLSGTWSRAADPQNGITLFQSMDDFFALYSAGVNGTDTGLSVGSDPVKTILVQAFFDNAPFIYGNTPQTTDYFASYEGTYALTPPANPGTYSSIDLVSGASVTFAATSVNISVVPEPSALLTLAGSTFVLALRRRIIR